MKKLRNLLSVILVISLLITSFSFATSVYADETITTNDVPENIQDGLILHAFCWGYSDIEANLPKIAAAGYTAIQTSPVQQPKDYSLSTNVTGQWWKLYQPVSFSIADNTWFGTKEELTSLCAEAKKYGIKIICDIVSNHLGQSTETEDFYQIAKEIKTYEPTIWNGNGKDNGYTEGNIYFHQNWAGANDADPHSVTQLVSSSCPDLNTSLPYIQQRVLSLLKECIDCGVSGFRFDAAKHIETPDDGEGVASDYWPTIVNGAKAYATEKGIDLYCYGEILNSVGTGRKYESYTNLMSVTDNKASEVTRVGVTSGNAQNAATNTYNVGTADKALLWAESHDTYLGKSDSTADLTNEQIVKTWAMVASRKDATALYFPRPDGMTMGDYAVDSTYKSVTVAEINKFHNLCVGEDERLGYSENFAYIERGQKGIVIVNTTGTTANVNMTTQLNDGDYTDMITGNSFKVENGTITGEIGASGVAVVTQGTTTPTVFADKENQSFDKETIIVKLSLSNATSATLQINDYEPCTFTEDITVRLGQEFDYGETIKLTLTATDGTKTTTNIYEYTKLEPATSGVYVMLDETALKNQYWTAPVYCYIYDEDTIAGKVYANAAWPGQLMEYDIKKECYFLQVKASDSYEQNKGSQELTESAFDLVKSPNTRVIFSDSSASNGSTTAGKQFPIANSAIKLPLNGVSKKMSPKFSGSNWKETSDIPAVTVFYDYDIVEGQLVSRKYLVGDVNEDQYININDVTLIQEYLAELTEIDCIKEVADVDGNGRLNIMDATYIQKHLADIKTNTNIGKDFRDTESSDPDNPTDDTTSTEPTGPVGTYTAYVKTAFTWIGDYDCKLFLYDQKGNTSYEMVIDDSFTGSSKIIYKAEVPTTCTDVIFYRAQAAVEHPGYASDAWNRSVVTMSETNNCYYWTVSDVDFYEGTGVPFTEEDEPTYSISRIYVDNSVAKWSEIYLYGWGGGYTNTETHKLTQIADTDIWYIDLVKPANEGEKNFLFKSVSGANDWNCSQSDNIMITSPYNCVKLGTEKGAETWTTYNG